MKILIVSQYFWPENFRINELVIFLISKGYSVEILTGYPNYPEGKIFENFKKNPQDFSELSGAKIFRIPVRLRNKSTKIDLFLNYLTFFLSSIFIGTYKLRKRKYDIIFTFATSPITVALTSIYFAKIKNCKNILWVLDLWPDILGELKIIKKKYILDILDLTVRFIYKRTDLILAQSSSFKEMIKQKYNSKKVEYFPAWAEAINLNYNNPNYVHELSFLKDNSKLKICFTGNIGEAQNFDNIIAAANLLKNEKDIIWIIVGTGRNINNVKQYVIEKKINNFHLLGNKPLAEIGFFHNIADILLVSLKSGKALSSTIPGKVQTYLNANKFILGFIEGEAKKIIEESRTGITVDPNYPEELAKKIIYLRDNRHLLHKVSYESRGTKFLEKKFNKKKIFENLSDHLKLTYESIEKIKLIKDPQSIPWGKNFTLSGLNLAFLGFYSQGKIKLHPNLYNWSDGIFFNRFFRNQTIKCPGRDLVDQIQLSEKIKKVYVFGSLSINSYNYLKTKYNKEIMHVDLPHDDADKLYNNYCKFNFTNEDFIILTLPTPKQEQFAELIVKNNKYYKIICVGGAVVMASGEERTVPFFLEKIGLEFMWRLRTDTKRRIKRLLVSFLNYAYAELRFKFSSLKKELIQKNES